MELFLNLCWLSLLLPAFHLWRQRTVLASAESTGRQGQQQRPLVLAGALGCAVILLFPVISATDDLHAMRPEMEESERALRDANRGSCATHTLAHSSVSVLLSSASLMPEFEQVGAVLLLLSERIGNFSAPAPAGRAPPVARAVSL